MPYGCEDDERGDYGKAAKHAGKILAGEIAVTWSLDRLHCGQIGGAERSLKPPNGPALSFEAQPLPHSSRSADVRRQTVPRAD